MVDISVCNRRDCPRKDTCFRYLADRDDYWQSELLVEKKILSSKGCDMYWQCRNSAELQYMNKVNR